MHISRALLAAALLLALFSTRAQAQSSCQDDTYTVLAGDSLFSIAEKCGIPYPALVGINVEISEPDWIYPGQVVRLEGGVPLYNNPVTGPAREGGLQPDGVYIAREGDSLARIAYLYQTSIAALLAKNPEIGMEKTIRVGQRIRLPDDARLEKGWVGVSSTYVDNYDTIEVRVVDFPPYSDIDLNLGELDIDNTVLAYETYEGVTDALGQARIEIEIPYYAWTGEEWVVEVVSTSSANRARALSPIMTIQ